MRVVTVVIDSVQERSDIAQTTNSLDEAAIAFFTPRGGTPDNIMVAGNYEDSVSRRQRGAKVTEERGKSREPFWLVLRRQ